jgi:UDP-glucose 4-epimerase
MRQAIRNEPMTVYGDGSQRRCFADVADVIEAVLLLLDHPKAPGNVFNIGNGQEEISIRDLAVRIRSIANSTSEISFVPYAEAYAPGFEDMDRRVPNVDRVQNLIGWTPKLSLNATLQRVHSWLLESAELDGQSTVAPGISESAFVVAPTGVDGREAISALA